MVSVWVDVGIKGGWQSFLCNIAPKDTKMCVVGETVKKIIIPTGNSISLQAMVFLCQGAGGGPFLNRL